MKILLFVAALLFSNSALSGCEILEDPPISEMNCTDESLRMPVGGEWTEISHNPSSTGLFSNGSLVISAQTELSSGSAAVGKFKAKSAGMVGSTVKLVDYGDVWVDVVLNRQSNNVYKIDLIAYRYVEGKLTQISANNGIHLGNSSTANYQLAYTFGSGSLTAQVKSSSGSLLGQLTIANFGDVLPMVSARRGTQSSGSNVTSAAFSVLSFTAN
jgi:hypothetical protein